MAILRQILPSLGLGWFVASTLVSCKDETIAFDEAAAAVANHFCDQYFACGCQTNSAVYSSVEQCRATEEAQAQRALDEGKQAMLAYDGECVERVLDGFDAVGCHSSSELTRETLASLLAVNGCKLFNGEVAGGSQCASLQYSNGDSCQKGTACSNGVCEVVQPPPGRGQPCDNLTTVCADGLYCFDFLGNGTNTCDALPGEGGTCATALNLCDFGLVCETVSKKCTKAPTAGQPCAPDFLTQCADGLVCQAGTSTCLPAPTGGMPCEANQCAKGFVCQIGTCVAQTPAICDNPFGIG